MANTIDHLRSELFDTLKRLKDKDAPLEIDRAKAVVEVARVLVDTARVEVAMIEATGIGGSGFIPDGQGAPSRGMNGAATRAQLPAGSRS